MSVELPGGKATMMRTGLVGNFAAGCACAGAAIAARPATQSKYLILLIFPMIPPGNAAALRHHDAPS
jgi:hypothetical protein